MAHFAELDESNIVINVIVVNNDSLDSANEEQSGIDFLTFFKDSITAVNSIRLLVVSLLAPEISFL